MHKVKLFSATQMKQLMFFFKFLRLAGTQLQVYLPLFALCVCYTLCEAVCADCIAWPRQIEVFVSNETHVPVKVGGVEYNVTVEFIGVPFFILADGVMVVFAEGEHSVNGHKKDNIVARYIETTGNNWVRRVTGNNGSNWKTQFAMQKEVQNRNFDFFLHSPIAVASKKYIYLLAISFNTSIDNAKKNSIQSTDFDIAIGEIKTNFTAQSADKIIEWEKLERQSASLTETLKMELPNIILYSNSAFVTKDGWLLFVFAATINNKHASVFVSSDKVGNWTKWEVSYVYNLKGCYYPCFFLWGSELTMISHRCPHGNQAVMKSTDMGRTWTTPESLFVRLLEKIDNKTDITVATINNKKALLCAQKKVYDTASGKKYEIHLWVSDGNRIRNIGPIAADNKYIYSTGFVYTNGELFFMHQQLNFYGSIKSILSHLDVEAKKITFILNTWDKTDKYLSQPCSKTATQDTQSATICATPVSTDGLVGFLSGGTNNNTHWHDEYLYMNATVKGGTRINNGFTFSGAGAGAVWNLERNEQIPYRSFVHHGLTVVATVRIHSALGDNTPLLTVGGASKDAERQGLWYGSDWQWRVMSGGNDVAVSAAGGWETNRTYSVALMVRNNTIAAYVNGRYVGGDVLRTPVYEERPLLSLYLFIAGYEDNDGGSTLSNVTVTNVLLYNRQLNKTELKVMSNTLES